MKPPRAPLGGAHRTLAEAATVVVAAGVICAMIAGFVGCTSENVDLGGTEMAEASSSLSYGFDAGEIADLCGPCVGSLNCPGGSICGALLPPDTNTYCGTLCPLGTECGDDETCTPMILSAEGERVSACVPNDGTCGAEPPLVIDGAMPEECGPLSGPSELAYCTGCRDPADCQQNGCYAGQWCDTRNSQCYDAPTTCP